MIVHRCCLWGSRSQRGQALPVVVLLLWMLAGLAVMVMALAERSADRARAQAAADAAALAGVADPGAETAVASRNGAVVLSSEATDGELEVLVEVGGASARARAERTDPRHELLNPTLVVAMRRAEALLGQQIPVVSGFRSGAQQQALWDARHTNPYPVARPGTSAHEQGMAIDVPAWFADRLAAVQDQSGLCQVLPVTDPIHFEPC